MGAWRSGRGDHALAAQVERLTGVRVERVYVDRGYYSQDADRKRVFVSRQNVA